MKKLITKIQYKNCEEGEYFDINFRSFEETLQLLNGFPWKIEREGLKVSITNPSIVIESGQGDYLQLALYYNGKYVLRFINSDGILFTKSLFEISASEIYLKKYFESSFSISDFKKENTWLKNNLKSVITQKFEYKVNHSTALKYLKKTTGFNFVLYCIILLFMIILPSKYDFSWIIMVIVFFVYIGFNLILFFNHFIHFKSKTLKISKGRNEFYFGTTGQLEEFKKSDIAEVVILNANNSRSPFNGFYVYKIKFINNNEIRLSNIFEDESNISEKFYNCTKRHKSGFAFV